MVVRYARQCPSFPDVNSICSDDGQIPVCTYIPPYHPTRPLLYSPWIGVCCRHWNTVLYKHAIYCYTWWLKRVWEQWIVLNSKVQFIARLLGWSEVEPGTTGIWCSFMTSQQEEVEISTPYFTTWTLWQWCWPPWAYRGDDCDACCRGRIGWRGWWGRRPPSSPPMFHAQACSARETCGRAVYTKTESHPVGDIRGQPLIAFWEEVVGLKKKKGNAFLV